MNTKKQKREKLDILFYITIVLFYFADWMYAIHIFFSPYTYHSADIYIPVSGTPKGEEIQSRFNNLRYHHGKDIWEINQKDSVTGVMVWSKLDSGEIEDVQRALMRGKKPVFKFCMA